ncbi:MAG: PDC sensor domain-containing protein, partial [Coriobacteriia bacterium]
MHTSIRTRLLVSLLAVAVFSAGALSWYFLHELEAYGLRKLEEKLGAEAQLAARMAGSVGIDDPDALQEAISGLELPGFSWIRVADADGLVIADSNQTVDGTDISQREEIREALAGDYGADSRMTGTGRLGLFVAYPVRDADGEVVGVTSSSAQTFSITTLLHDYRLRLGALVLGFAIFTWFLAEVMTRWLASPLLRLES